MMKLSCRESARLLSVRLDRKLTFREQIALRMHLTICLACRRFDRHMRILKDAMKNWREHF